MTGEPNYYNGKADTDKAGNRKCFHLQQRLSNPRSSLSNAEFSVSLNTNILKNGATEMYQTIAKLDHTWQYIFIVSA